MTTEVNPVKLTDQILHENSRRDHKQINLMWERTQAAIAISITLAYILQHLGIAVRLDASEGLASAFFLVVGFYFGRTNHSRPTARTITSEGKLIV